MWLTLLILESWIILKESAAVILVGFLIAGGLHVVLAKARWVDWLKGLGARSVLLASAVGFDQARRSARLVEGSAHFRASLCSCSSWNRRLASSRVMAAGGVDL